MNAHQAKAKKWVIALMSRHIGRLKLDDGPEQGTEQWADAALIWDEAFQVVNASEKEADKASRRVASQPTPWWREQLPAVLAAIELERTANFAQPVEVAGKPLSDRESAMAASATCEWCEGRGLVVVFRRRYDGQPTVCVDAPDGRKVRVLARCVIACGCQYGRWILGRLKPEDAKRLDGFGAVEAGRSAYTALDPTDPENHRIAAPNRRNPVPY